MDVSPMKRINAEDKLLFIYWLRFQFDNIITRSLSIKRNDYISIEQDPFVRLDVVILYKNLLIRYTKANSIWSNSEYTLKNPMNSSSERVNYKFKFDSLI